MNNIVAKIVIVAQLVFSLCFMCFAGAVYSFQAGWKGKALAAEKKWEDLNASYDELQVKKLDLEKSLTANIAGWKTRAEGAEAKVTQLDTDLKQAVGSLANAEQQRDKHLADLAVAQQEAQARITETTDSRGEIKRLRDQASEAIATRRQLEDTNLDLNGKLAVSDERTQLLLERVGRLRDLCRANKVDPDAVIAGPIPPAIEKVDGVVKDARKNGSRSAEHVQISIGSDDGISQKMRLIIYRNAEFICEIEVTEVYPDAAVGRVLEETRNGTIERGDNVTTKL